MAIGRRTWRDVDGERIEGTWRHAFINNGGTYYLADLLIYADAMVDCWGLETLEGFAARIDSGWVATELPEGARASAHHFGSWRFAEPETWLTPEMLLGEVRDDIDTLNGRPDSTGRCLAVLDVFRAEPTDENRAAFRAAYDAIPEHLRSYALGDQDNRDWPLRVVAAGPGHPMYPPEPEGEHQSDVVTEEMYAAALAYFTSRDEELREYEQRVPADGLTEPVDSSIIIGMPGNPDVRALRNEFPAPIVIGDRTYPTVMHAYWAHAVTDEKRRAEILATDKPYAAQKLAQDSTVRDDWPRLRVAVMTRLLRAKFQQHPELAEALLATGATRLIYTDVTSTFWGHRGAEGRNWTGRLLELIRSELAAGEM